MAARFVLNPAGLQRLFTSPAGPIAIDLTRRAIRVESQAKINASGRPGPNVITGRGRASITHRLAFDDRGLFAEVGTNVFYMGLLETGRTRNGAKYPFLVPALQAAR